MSILALALTVVPAAAETIVISPTSTADIQGHDANSRFLSGAFLPVPANWHGSSSTQPQIDVPVSSLLPVQQRHASFDLILASNDPDAESDAKSGSTASSRQRSGIVGGLGPFGSDPVSSVGTVPLPPALPLFGAALLGLSAFGVGLRRRRSARGA